MNKNLLNYEIKKNGYTTESFCKAIGLSQSTFSKKKNGKSDFTVTEVRKIAELLHLDSVEPIFFAR